MSAQVSVDITVDAKDVDHLLSAFANAISPMSLEMLLSGGVADALRFRAQNRFTTEGDSASGNWAALRPATEEIREFFGYPRAHPINTRSGELRRFVGQSHGTARPAVDGAELTWPGPAGGDVEDKLKVAQKGSPRGSNPWFRTARTPQRPVVAVDQADLAEILLAVGRHLEDAMRTGGFSVFS